MDIGALFQGVLSNAVWALIALAGSAIVVGAFAWVRKRPLTSYRLGERMRKEGITRLIFSRSEYPERLADYLMRAKHSIQMVSITLKLTSDESALREVFSKKLASSENFTICISLLRPGSNACVLASDSLGIKPDELSKEVQAMLNQLSDFRGQLPEGFKQRFVITTHSCFPMGSAIMLDATPERGTIQVETKLFRAPRIESFSFEVIGPSIFYTRNFTAWRKVLDSSKTYTIASNRSQR